MRLFSTAIALLWASFSLNAQNFAGESLEYDAQQNRFFSSANGGSIVQRAANGEISFFGSGLQATHGMEVMNNTLFAIAGSNVFGYDLDTETQVMQLTIPGATFLNGMASDGNSRLWVTDFSAKRIIEIDVSDYSNPTSEVVVANTVTTPNGIVYDETEDRLIFVNWGSNAPIKEVILSDYSVNTLMNTGLGNVDGVDKDNLGNFYISSWSPNRITRYNSDFSTAEIISAPGITNPADICYALEIDTLAIPNGNGTVTFVGFSLPTSLEDLSNKNAFSVYPNPINENSQVVFELKESGPVKISIAGSDGRQVFTVLDERLPSGQHRVLLSGFVPAPGQYILSAETPGGRFTKKIFSGLSE
jgi:hypothetical protein